MKIGLVGYQGSGKSTLFEWLSGVAPEAALAHTGQTAMVPLPDPRIDALCKIIQPKKTTIASLELVDTPGLARNHQGNAARLSLIREAGCLVLVVAAFDGSDPLAELNSFAEDFQLADMETVSGRIERLRESVKKPKPRPNREQELAQLEALQQVLASLEAGHPLHTADMTPEQIEATRSFKLLTEKPTLVLINAADDEEDPSRLTQGVPQNQPILAARVRLELELARMDEQERAEFARELGLSGTSRDLVLRKILEVSGQIVYFTVGPKEVRSWLLGKGQTALDAAGNIHTDLARGFIRAETMHCEDLIRLGSEREVKAHNLLRQEPKDYVVHEGDILLIRFSV